jgi:hypothetical protein
VLGVMVFTNSLAWLARWGALFDVGI